MVLYSSYNPLTVPQQEDELQTPSIFNRTLSGGSYATSALLIRNQRTQWQDDTQHRPAWQILHERV